MADAGTSLDRGDEGQKGEYAAFPRQGLGMERIKKRQKKRGFLPIITNESQRNIAIHKVRRLALAEVVGGWITMADA